MLAPELEKATLSTIRGSSLELVYPTNVFDNCDKMVDVKGIPCGQINERTRL